MERPGHQGKTATAVPPVVAPEAAVAPETAEEPEPVFTLQPAGRGGHPRARGLRVVGPGRRELEYLGRLESLEGELQAAQAELEVAAVVERGTSRFVERLEDGLARTAGERDGVRQQLHRVLVALGSTQEQAQDLRRRLARAEARLAAIEAPPARRGWLARIAGRNRA